MTKLDEVVAELERRARPSQIAGMVSYGMSARGRLGVSIPELRRIAKSIGKTMAWPWSCGRQVWRRLGSSQPCG